uniref:Uncharacterized protein n=1 Tax=Rhizophora mucronata TaxID=61149 RepID=A0A2P2IZD9_RHIMU
MTARDDGLGTKESEAEIAVVAQSCGG